MKLNSEPDRDPLADLSSYDASVRSAAIPAAVRLLESGRLAPESGPRPWLNLHLHTFHSFHCLDWSPARAVLECRRLGLRCAGTVDFDTLAGLEETFAAGRAFGLPVLTGFESRVFVAEYRDRVLNSPGEPGIYYFCGLGFTVRPDPASAAGRFLAGLKETAQARNRKVIDRLNRFLGRITLNYREDLLPLTPSANPTERHIILAYLRKAETLLAGETDRFWAGVLGVGPEETAALRQASPAAFQERLRSRLVKRGGPGYIEPEERDFPRLEEVAAATRAAGGRPVATWLDGTSPGEADPDQWLDFFIARSLEAVAIIPERNWNLKDPEEKRRKVANLEQFLAACRRRDFPVLCGTEMNRSGQPPVDDFSRPELAGHLDYFLASAGRFLPELAGRQPEEKA
ncbi:MAG: hypothetical protein BWY73_01006 [candidate division TA06 bacterium ADurb.Bin417]|uniref:Polymerase/histidinol phosphatase N-terminal domain-containing protein n=1 Tax=candidate division TA06 bacterium ADurb.Bin417 TaxID=1852828 RepID=A0A1V5MF29_UNCT6|nr:MAG: hypothetical protein BWY73_01006 [candidate division TA06 bacterium ADurb.Bin417]